MATLQNIKIEADALKVRCLNEIADMESKLQAQHVAEETMANNQQPDLIREEKVSYGKKDHKNVISIPRVKKQRTVSIKTINTENTWQLETADDVKRYVSGLEKKLLDLLEDHIIIHVEF